jgi:hypothetical protein
MFHHKLAVGLHWIAAAYSGGGARRQGLLLQGLLPLARTPAAFGRRMNRG